MSVLTRHFGRVKHTEDCVMAEKSFIQLIQIDKCPNFVTSVVMPSVDKLARRKGIWSPWLTKLTLQLKTVAFLVWDHCTFTPWWSKCKPSLTFCSFLPPLSLSEAFAWPRPLSAGLASRDGLLLGPPAGLRPPLSPPRSRSGRLLGAADGRFTDGL